MAEQRLLLIDTCGSESSIALAGDGQLFTATLPARTAASDSLTAVRNLLSQANWKLADLTAIAVVNGPGSFTGVRVGVALAKGLAESVSLPLIAISRLAVLRQHAPAAALDAGRGEFYFGDPEGEALLTAAELTTRIGSQTLAVCEPRVADALSTLSLLSCAQPRAEDALPLALTSKHITAEELDAFYLRRPDAELAMLRARAAQ